MAAVTLETQPGFSGGGSFEPPSTPFNDGEGEEELGRQVEQLIAETEAELEMMAGVWRQLGKTALPVPPEEMRNDHTPDDAPPSRMVRWPGPHAIRYSAIYRGIIATRFPQPPPLRPRR